MRAINTRAPLFSADCPRCHEPIIDKVTNSSDLTADTLNSHGALCEACGDNVQVSHLRNARIT